ncbi:substrate-binding periplasmic protein [Lacibacterium aquatile]|uniref:Substrate-binding periplasmic protein n=1 Tax=Lacibacterium aquatile TaxID=1168082 RepID=A0ABW5E0V0_9PROT
MRTSTALYAFVTGAFVFGHADAREIRIGLREVPPYVVQAGDSYVGLDYEVISAALAARSHTLRVTLMPFARLTATFQQNLALDAAAPVIADFKVGGEISDPYAVYTNVALTLAKNDIRLESIADLARYRVMAFQNATSALGLTFSKTMAGNLNYREEATQLVAVRALFFERTDVVIGERRILRYLMGDPSSGIDPDIKTVEHPLFAPVSYSVVFRDPMLAADFNAGLAAIRADGTYDAILRKY